MNMAHCIAWKKVMNWTALTKLDLGAAQSYDFLVVFCGSVPQLKSLKFRLTEPLDAIRTITEQFLDGINALEHLTIQDETRFFFVDLCASIRKHGGSLKFLDINPSILSSTDPAGIASDHLGYLLETLPRLQNLALAVDLGGSDVQWPRNVYEWVMIPNVPTQLLR
jgi:hypothetical protein